MELNTAGLIAKCETDFAQAVQARGDCDWDGHYISAWLDRNWSQYYSMMNRFDTNGQSAGLSADEATSRTNLLTELASKIAAVFRGHKNNIYHETLDKLTSSTTISADARDLSGTSRVIAGYVAFGLPRSLEQNDFLRALLYGKERILDTEAIGSVYNDAIAKLQAGTDGPKVDISAIATDRANALAQVLDNILTRIGKSQFTESSPLVEATWRKIDAYISTKDLVIPVYPVPTLALQNQMDRRISLLSFTGMRVTSSRPTTPTLPVNWRVVAMADFDRDGQSDLVVQNGVTRAISILYMNGGRVRASKPLNPTVPTGCTIMAAADINQDGMPDLVVQNVTSQRVSVLTMSGAKITGSYPIDKALVARWHVVGAAEFSGDGQPDLLVQNANAREISVLTLSGCKVVASSAITPTLPPGWSVGEVVDYHVDGLPDIVVTNSSTRQMSLLTVENMKVTASLPLSPAPLPGWALVGPR